MNGNVFLFCIIMLLDLGFAVLCFSKIIKLFIINDYKQIKKKEKENNTENLDERK